VEKIFVEPIENTEKNLEIISYGFPKEKKHIWPNSRKDGPSI
jgi:hypothetical protein